MLHRQPHPKQNLLRSPLATPAPAAETAITIDDVVVVINAGRLKEKSYDPYTNVSTLMVGGRKGREGDGKLLCEWHPRAELQTC